MLSSPSSYLGLVGSIAYKGHLFIPRRPKKTREDPKRRTYLYREDPKRHLKRLEKTFLLLMLASGK